MSGFHTDSFPNTRRHAPWHRWARVLCCLLLLPLGAPLAAQADEDYFAFWPGAWYAIQNGVRDSVPTFVVRTTANSRAFLEEWRLVIDGVGRIDGRRARLGRFRIGARACTRRCTRELGSS